MKNHSSEPKSIARIFEDVGGYFYCDEGLDYLDARGVPNSTKKQAMESAKYAGYTHARGSGTYRGNKLTKL